MNIYCIEFEATGMSQEEIANELTVMDETLRAIGGGLLNSNRHNSPNRWLGYVHAESGQALKDIFEASEFTVIRVEFIGPSHAIHRLGLQSGRKFLDFTDSLPGSLLDLNEAAMAAAKPGLA